MRDKNMKSSVLLATDGCLTRMSVAKGASTLVDDGPKEAVFYATEVASPVVFLGHRLQSLKDIPVILYTRLKSRPLVG